MRKELKMGCWFKTCGLSNLHIKDNEDVCMFVLEQTAFHDRCYTTSFWKPVLLPIDAVYDDYGGAKDVDSFFDHVLKSINKQNIKIEKNPYDSSDTLNNNGIIDATSFFEAIKDGRLISSSTTAYGLKDTQIDFVMMKKSIVDHILKNYQNEIYRGLAKETADGKIRI